MSIKEAKKKQKEVEDKISSLISELFILKNKLIQNEDFIPIIKYIDKSVEMIHLQRNYSYKF